MKVPKCNSTVSRKVKLCERVKRPFCPNLDLLDLGNWIFWTDGSDLLSLLMAGVGSGSHPPHIERRRTNVEKPGGFKTGSPSDLEVGWGA